MKQPDFKKAFAGNFEGRETPRELSLLLKFETDDMMEYFAESFYLTADGKSLISSWSEDPEFVKRIMPFATANASGSGYALWDDGQHKSLSDMPVVVFGDEGGVHVVAKNVLELMQLLTYDTEISVDHESAYFYKDEDEHEGSENAATYREWLKETFGVDAVEETDSIIKAAQDEYKDSFDAWFAQYYS
jgi:hypothetical protein